MKKRVTIRKYLGDDPYSWAVFIDGVPKWTGLSRREAQFYRDQEVRLPRLTPDPS